MCDDSYFSGKAGIRRAAIENMMCEGMATRVVRRVDRTPRLSSRLAAAKRSTAETAEEQANAGLDSLIDEKHATFTDLDIRYTEKFGSPFMIAVCDLDRIDILAAFELRIENDRETGYVEACAQVRWIAGSRPMEVMPT